MENANNGVRNEEIVPEVIYAYTQDQAIEDGVLVLVGYAAVGAQKSQERVVLTRTLFEQGYADENERRRLLIRGFSLLLLADAEDSPTMKLRVIEKGKIWVIWNEGEGYTFLTPDDY